MSNLDDFLATLSEDQKNQLFASLVNKSKDSEVKPKKKKSSPKVKPVVESPVIKQTSQVSDDFRVVRDTNQKRKEPVRANKNRWEDTGEDRHIETPDFEPTPRNRKVPEKVEVDCHVCGKSFKVDPRFIYGEYYRCNRCPRKK